MSGFAFHVESEPARVTVITANNTAYELPALWLRERCQDEASLDNITQQRLFNPHNLQDDLSLIAAEARANNTTWLAFSDGYSCEYDFTKLHADFDLSDGLPAVKPWKSDFALSDVTFDWNKVCDQNYRQSSIRAYLTYGMIILRNVPTEKEQIITVAESYGHVRTTNFGKYFEVYSKPDSNDLAYRPIPLAPHTDNPYRDPVPGIQLLHCLINETNGGLSTLVDSLSVAEQLRCEDPEGFALLSSVPVRFQFVDNGIQLTARRPIIHLNTEGNVTGVHYSPRLDYLPLLDNDTTVKFHRARRRFGELASHADYEIRFPLRAGELMMLDNNRVLHGRTAYDPNGGRRHLQGCYIDRDGPRGLFKAFNHSTLMSR